MVVFRRGLVNSFITHGIDYIPPDVYIMACKNSLAVKKKHGQIK